MRKPRLKRMKMSRKAQAESQLNWIFILIVGAIILAFFTFIVIKQRAASEAKFAGKVSQQLDTILAGAKVSSGTVQIIPTPELSIRFTCNDYYIGPASQRLGNKVVFAPEFVEGNQIITWTVDWNVPYKVASLLFVTAPTVRYIIVGQTSSDKEAKAIYDALPAKLNKKLYSITDYSSGTITDENDAYVRFVFVNPTGVYNIPSDFSDAEVSGLSVDNSNMQVQFLERSVSSPNSFTTTGGKQGYTEDALLYGAVFSTRYDDYACLLTRAYSRLNMVSRVYYEKLNVLGSEWTSTSCEGFYKDNTKLKSMIDATNSYPPTYADIGTGKRDLKEMNEKLQLYSCPLIY